MQTLLNIYFQENKGKGHKYCGGKNTGNKINTYDYKI